MAKRLGKPKEMAAFTDGIKKLEQQLGFNFESLHPQLLQNYQAMTKLVTPFVAKTFLPKLDIIGKLQLLRKIVCSQINFTSRVESPHYTNCLSTLNQAVLNNLQEIRENAVATFVEEAEEGAGTEKDVAA